MNQQRLIRGVLVSSLSLGLLPFVGCENLPGNKSEQGAVIGGLGGAAAGAAVAKNNRVLGALIGGALGAGGGYLIGAQMDKTSPQHRDEAVKASKQAQANPATPADVARSQTADLNDDGYVTLDEVVAMHNAGLSDAEMIRRLQLTHQVFELTPQQEQTLRNNGVDQQVIDAMLSMNHPVTGSSGGGDLNQTISHPQ